MAETSPPDFCFLGIDTWATCLSKGEWASWVQAIGTIGAVLAAVWLARRAADTARAEVERKALAEQIQRLETIGRTLLTVYWTFNGLYIAANSGNYAPMRQYLRAQLQGLEKLDPFGLRWPEVTMYVYDVQAVAMRVMSTIDQAQSGTLPPGFSPFQVHEDAAQARDQTAAAIQAIRTAIQQAGGEVEEWKFGHGEFEVRSSSLT